MTAYKPRDTHDPHQAAKLPVSLEAQLMPGTLQFEIHTMVESQMAMSIPDDSSKNHRRGRAAHSDPKILLKTLLLAYCRGITSLCTH
jgi:hypothetical protein